MYLEFIKNLFFGLALIFISWALVTYAPFVFGAILFLIAAPVLGSLTRDIIEEIKEDLK